MGTRTDSRVIYRPDGSTETVTWDVETSPVIMSKTAFNKYVAGALGGGDLLAGADIFQAIMDACENGQGRIKFCFTQYDSANTFEKNEVEMFTQAMADVGIMTTNQRNAILNPWPEI